MNIFSLIPRNQDFDNYVIKRGYLSIFTYAMYGFLVYLIVLIFQHENIFNSGTSEERNYGAAILGLTTLVIIASGIIYVQILINKKYPSSLAGLVVISLLIILSLIFFTFEPDKFGHNFMGNIYYIGIIVLLLFSFVSYFCPNFLESNESNESNDTKHSENFNILNNSEKENELKVYSKES